MDLFLIVLNVGLSTTAFHAMQCRVRVSIFQATVTLTDCLVALFGTCWIGGSRSDLFKIVLFSAFLPVMWKKESAINPVHVLSGIAK
jgi:hypothetical protein